MLYLSAQPDTTYFIWQLEIQLRNLLSLGVLKENIQVLIAYNQDLELNPDYQRFIDENKHLAQFYIYPDLRERPKYISSVRPNILKQHFMRFPELSEMTIMYHDSDILFSRIPKIEDVEKNDICYVSDTRNYLDINYIRATGNEDLLDEMLSIVGLSKEKLIQENEQTGGAQYILKGITTDFWEKVEEDSENLYVAMRNYNRKLWEKEYPEKRDYRSKKRGIQAWCADMWAVLWNLWLENKPVEIHLEMEFSWPYSAREDWNRLAIQHYSGNIEDKAKFFKKTEYLNYTPWYDTDLDIIPNTSCSYEIVKLIKARRMELDSERPAFPNKMILLKGETNDDKNKKLFTLYRNYITKYLDIKVMYLNGHNNTSTIIYKDPISMDKMNTLSPNCVFLIIPIDVLIPIEDIEKLLQQESDQAFKLNNAFVSDTLFAEAFSKMLDIQLLTENKSKFNESECSRCIELVDNNTFTNGVLKDQDTYTNIVELSVNNCFILN